MRLFLIATLLVACAGPSHPPQAPAPSTQAAELEHIDVFGSRRLDRDKVIANWGAQLAALLHIEPDSTEFQPRKAALEADILRSGQLALVEISVVTYEANRRFVTVDLVDAEDRDRRMRFLPQPTATLADPDGLITLWNEYEEAYRALWAAGEIKPPLSRCPFWHCLTFDHPSLVTYRDAFATRVQSVEQALTEILRADKRPTHRGAAAFLLAHIASGDRVVELMLPATRDPHILVRNNAMRVLAIMAEDHPEISIPSEPILEVLTFPTTLDRNKAAAVLEGMTRHASAELRETIRTRAGEILVEMLALHQPNNHNFAYLILKHISGRDLGEHAVDAWRAWVHGG